MRSSAVAPSLDSAIELRHLRAFVAVAEELSFTRAAARLHIAQSPLSRQIRRLEAHLGARLLDRDTHSVELTEAGRALLADACRVLDAADASFARARRAHRGEAGTLRVGYVPSTAWGPLPEVLDTLAVRLPDVRVLAKEVWADELEDRLLDGSLHLGVTRTVPEVAGLEHEPLAREGLSVLMRARSSEPAAPVRLADVARRRLLLAPRESDHGFHDLVVALCRSSGFEPRVLLSAMPARRGGSPLATGRAIALIPADAGADPPPGVAAHPLAEPPVLRSLVLWRRTSAAPVLHRSLEVLREVRDRAAWAPAGAG